MASWGSLPSTAIDRICYNLLDYEDCSDVDHLSMFMGRAKNRPSTEKMEIVKEEAGLTVEVSLSSSFLPYYGLATLDKGRFERVGPAAHPRLRVTLSGPEDPIIEQVSGLLSASIHEVSILLRPVVPVSDLSLCSQLLRNSPIAKITIDTPMREEEIGPSILSIASHARRQPQPNRGDGTVRSGRLSLLLIVTRLSVAFISQLCSSLTIHLSLDHWGFGEFFGIDSATWENFLNQKLSNGELESVDAGSMAGIIIETQAPMIDFPQVIPFLKLKKVE